MAKYYLELDTEKNTVKIIDNIGGSALYTLADCFEAYEGTKEYNGIVAKIQEWFYGYVSKTAWCATSVSYFADYIGIADQVGKYENVDKMKEHFNTRGFLDCTPNYGGGKYKAKRGDLVFFSDNHTYADCTHVGVVQAINHDTGYLKWIGGNTGDAIASRETNYLTDKYVVAFGRVDY